MRYYFDNMKKYLSPEGLEKLKKELDYLKNVKRKEIAEKLQRSTSFGDLSENSEFAEAKEDQAFVEGRILELEELIRSAVIVSESGQKDLAQIGSTILVSFGDKTHAFNLLDRKNIQKFKIVGAEEANLSEGKISVDSPVGKAILNQPRGSIIEVNTPSGKIRYKILKIE